MMALLILLSACGGDEPATPPISSPTPGQAAMSTPGEQVANSTIDQDVNRVAGSATAEVTLGDLVDRINAQWTDLDAFREISTSNVSPAASPAPALDAASPASDRSQRAVREVILPDRVRYTAEQGGRLVYELIVIGDLVFARGTVAALLDPTAEPDEWIETDLETLAANPMLGEAAAVQLADLAPPRYTVPDRLRPQAVRALDPVSMNGAACRAYGAADTTASGARISLTFAVAADDRSCFVQTEAVGISSRYTVEALDDSFTIDAPDDARAIASPIASPVASATTGLTATPEGTP